MLPWTTGRNKLVIGTHTLTMIPMATTTPTMTLTMDITTLRDFISMETAWLGMSKFGRSMAK